MDSDQSNIKEVIFKNLKRSDEAIKLDPNDSSAWNYKGYTLNKLKRHEEALKCYDEAIRLDPNNSYAWNNKGIALNELKRHEEALMCHDEDIKLDPNNFFAWNNKGCTLKELKRHEEALKCYDEAIKLDPNNFIAWNNKGYALNELKRHQEAIEYFDMSLKLNPSYANALNGKGICFKYQGKFEEAIECFDEALKLNDELTLNKTLTGKGHTLMLMQKYQEALKCFDESIKLDPKKTETFLYKTHTLILMKKLVDAKSIIENISESEIENHNKKVYFYVKGMLSQKESKFDEAITFYNEALKTDENYYDAIISIGICCNESGKYQEALDCFNKVLKMNNLNKDALLGKANSFRNMNKIDEAIYYYNEALKLDIDFKDAYYNMALLYKQTNNLLKVIENLNEVIEIDPQDLVMYELRGDVYSELEDFELALKDYNAALKLENHNDNILSKKILIEKKRLRLNEEMDFYYNEARNKKSFEEILTDQVRIEIDNQNFSMKIPNETISFDNDKFKIFEENEKSLMIDIQKKIHGFNKLKLKISNINQYEILNDEDRKDLEHLKSDIKELESEATRINSTLSADITLADRTLLNKTSVFLKEKMLNMEKKIFNLNQKYQHVNNKMNNYEERITIIEKELLFCLKDYEEKIINRFKNNVSAEDSRKIEDYIYGFKSTLSNVFVAAQVIETNLIQINNSSTPISILSSAASLIPVIGGGLKFGITTIWEFLNNRKVKKNAKKILKFAYDGPQFSQKIGGLLEAILNEEDLRTKITSLNDSVINKNSSSFFGKVKKIFTEIAEKIKEKLYTDLYTTSFKKLGFLQANLIIENIYNGKLDACNNIHEEAIIIITKDFDDNYETQKGEKSVHEQDKNENRSTNQNLKKSKGGCCTIF